MDHCGECDFTYDPADASAAGPTIRDGVVEVVSVLRRRAGDDLRTRRRPGVWSPLEYACHLRDVLLVQRERVLAVRRTERPVFAPMGRDERVDHEGYAEQDLDDVLRQLGDAAGLFGNVLARLDPGDWDRDLVYPYPGPTTRTLAWMAVHTVHEVRHHLRDIRLQVEPAAG
ncbi:DinB family protein [Saccharothrix saharensis]|uniref:DinB family protein n=1 Tax=Saccharothrix saharensis TaxID=571190 RepID=A0A543J8H1_9PSEU|nr:DinB family protein [Saccharothrix saharensis]TQM79135.1 DinB family protein [Saccharothrix saharensis]